jgi:ankyrin repeat protein
MTANFNLKEKKNYHVEDLWNAIVLKDKRMAVKIIESLQINLDERDKDDCYSSALHMAAETGQDEIVACLIKFGAPVDSKNKLDDTPLMLAAANGHLTTCKLLVQNDANVSSKDADSYQAIHFAANRGHAEVCQWLI